jgi:sugar phosphate isomerase/epimerase
MNMNRRNFLKSNGLAGLALSLPAGIGKALADHHASAPLYRISLAQWSLHRAFRSGEMDSRDFAKIARESFDIDAIEYVNQFFKDKAGDKAYISDLDKRAKDHGVKQLLIMCDGEGNLGDPDKNRRMQAVENHYKWVEAAKSLGCHSIRVNAASRGSYQEQIELAADGLARLSEFAAGHGLNVIVENHGGLSSNGAWLSAVIRKVNLRNCGTLPDFGNFRVSGDEWYDRYTGVRELMPYAYAVSAKSHDFNDLGNEAHTDYYKMMKIVLNAGYHGFVGIEYEGGKVSEMDGIRMTRDLLLKVREVLS